MVAARGSKQEDLEQSLGWWQEVFPQSAFDIIEQRQKWTHQNRATHGGERCSMAYTKIKKEKKKYRLHDVS